MSTITTREGTQVSDNGDADAVPASSHALFVSPHRRRNGFWASIRGHVLDLADPSSAHGLAPTPDDLFIVSIAAEPDDVNVSAEWRRREGQVGRPSVADIILTVTVSRRAKPASAALADAFAKSLAARSVAEPVAHISWKGANS